MPEKKERRTERPDTNDENERHKHQTIAQSVRRNEVPFQRAVAEIRRHFDVTAERLESATH